MDEIIRLARLIETSEIRAERSMLMLELLQLVSELKTDPQAADSLKMKAAISLELETLSLDKDLDLSRIFVNGEEKIRKVFVGYPWQELDQADNVRKMVQELAECIAAKLLDSLK